MQYMKVNQVVSQRPIFSFKANFPDEQNNKTQGGVWQIHTILLNSNKNTKTELNTEFKMYWFLDSTENPPITGN